jgi:autoaggregation protein RapA/B/C
MANHKPVAGDYYFLTGFDPTKPVEANLYYDNSILSNTPLFDADGDPVHLAFVNGQRIASSADPSHPKETVIHGEYGTLTIDPSGYFSYSFDQTSPAVVALGAEGGTLDDHFTFKVSDGRGGTDFGYFDLVTEAPAHGTTTIGFEDASQDFPFNYKGLEWGSLWDADPMTMIVDSQGNHFLESGVYTTTIVTANGNDVTFDGVDISASTSKYGADITFTGFSADGSQHTLTTSISPGSDNFDMSLAQHVSLESLGPIDQLRVHFDFPGYDYNPDEHPVLLFDNFTITV